MLFIIVRDFVRKARKAICKNRSAAQFCAIRGLGKPPNKRKTLGSVCNENRAFWQSVITLALLARL